MTQQQIFDLVYEKYKDIIPNMKHGSGGLPDSKGEGTSDVDICIYHEDYTNLGQYFPADTKVDNQEGRTIYSLSGYDREVNLYCTDGDWWDNGAKHRETEIALNESFPELSEKAFAIKKETGLSTEQAWRYTVNTSDFYIEYFLSNDCIDDLEVLGIKDRSFTTTSEVIAALYSIDYAKIDAKELKKISGNSKIFAENRMAEEFAATNFETTESVIDPVRITIVRNPEELARKVRSLRELKNFYRKQTRELEQVNTPSSQAKVVMLDLHRRRTNELLAQTYPLIVAFLDQYSVNQSQSETRIAQMLTEDVRGFGIISDNRSIQEGLQIFSEEKRHRSLARIERYINGAGILSGTEAAKHNYISLSSEALALADQLDERTPETSQNHYEFEDESRETLASIFIDAEQMAELSKTVLGKYEILSAQIEYDPDRSEPAEDGKWQVVIDPSEKRMSVDVKRRVFKIPNNYSRNLSNVGPPMGAIPALDHEIAHLLQHENKRRLNLGIMEKDIGLDRRSVFAEAGAIAWETECQTELFGQIRPTNPHYLRAAQARLTGGSLKDCALAFYNSYIAQDSSREGKDGMLLAIDRASRLFRNSGDFRDMSMHLTNSQPLYYLEQELVARELNEQGLSKFLMIGGINIDVLATLLNTGIINIDEINLPEQRPSEVVLPEIRAMIKTYKDTHT